MHRKGLYKTAVELAGPTASELKSPPPEPRVPSYMKPPALPDDVMTRYPYMLPANDRLLETKAVTASSPSGYIYPNVFRMHNRQGSAIDVDTRTDTPYAINTGGWTPPTGRPFNYSEFYNAQVDDPQGWNKYQEYQRNLPIEDINKVTRVPQHDANIRGTDQYSSADDFVNTVGQGPSFRWHSVPTVEDAGTAIQQGPQRDHTPIYAISNESFPWQGLYFTAWNTTPYGSIMLSKDPTRNYLASPDKGILNDPQLTTTMDGENNKLVSVNSGYLPTPQVQLAGHEMTHALTAASRSPGTEVRHPRPATPAEGRPSEAGGYSYNPVEQVQAVHTLNKSYQALLNSLAKGNHKDMPSEFRKIVDTYPAYGSQEQFMARNDALLAHPELAVKYLGVEPSRALAQLKQLKHNAWLQQQGLYTTPRNSSQRSSNSMTPDVGDAQTYLDFFNDNYFRGSSASW